MEEVHRKLLKRSRVCLAKDLEIDEVLQYLIEAEILSDHLVEKINAKPTSFDKNVEFLNLLPKRGPSAFKHFLSSLDKTDQSHLAKKLLNFSSKNDASQLCSLNNVVSHVNSQPLRVTVSSTTYASPATKEMDSPAKKRIPVERNQPLFHTLKNNELPSFKKQNVILSSNCKNKVDVIPSPCGELDDLASVESFESLATRSCFKIRNSSASPKSIVPSETSANSCDDNSIKKNAISKFIDGCDLSDGPTYQDLIVRRFPQMNQTFSPYDSYEISSSPRGLALIVSVDHFEPSACLDNRQAADVDRARLEFVLRQLGFKCFKLVDGTGKEIWDILRKFVSLDEHHHCDVAVLVVMSHGEEGCFFGRDGDRVYTQAVIELFNNEKCKGLQNKPKVLLFQCCRGSVIDKGVDEAEGRGNSPVVAAPEADTTSSRSSVNSSIVNNKLPTHSDCLVGYATVKGFAAMRNTKHGSWYIQALVRVLAFHACDKHLVEMMTIVNNLIKYREGNSPATEYHRCKEMSIFNSTLCKKLYLFPGT